MRRLRQRRAGHRLMLVGWAERAVPARRAEAEVKSQIRGFTAMASTSILRLVLYGVDRGTFMNKPAAADGNWYFVFQGIPEGITTAKMAG